MLLLATGGTIDKEPAFLENGEFDHSSKKFKDTYLPQMIEMGGIAIADYQIHQAFMVDSLDMTDELREQINDWINEFDDPQVVVTHGTDTMPETARFLLPRQKDRTIVLTGAMEPFSVMGFGKESDALFNLWRATDDARLLPPGVYVEMNGQIFPADNVRKNVAARRFERIRP